MKNGQQNTNSEDQKTSQTAKDNNSQQQNPSENKSAFFNESQQKSGVHVKASSSAKLNENIPYVGGSEASVSVEVDKPEKPDCSIC